jgi:hypothetical protein
MIYKCTNWVHQQIFTHINALTWSWTYFITFPYIISMPIQSLHSLKTMFHAFHFFHAQSFHSYFNCTHFLPYAFTLRLIHLSFSLHSLLTLSIHLQNKVSNSDSHCILCKFLQKCHSTENYRKIQLHNYHSTDNYKRSQLHKYHSWAPIGVIN